MNNIVVKLYTNHLHPNLELSYFLYGECNVDTLDEIVISREECLNLNLDSCTILQLQAYINLKHNVIINFEYPQTFTIKSIMYNMVMMDFKTNQALQSKLYKIIP